MKKRKIISSQQVLEIILLYQSGLGGEAIGQKFDLHPNSIRRILKRNSIEIRLPKRKLSDSDIINICNDYILGLSIDKVAKKFKVSGRLVYRYLQRNKIPIRSYEESHRKYQINEHFFDNIDTEKKAYMLGFMYADAGVGKISFSLNLNAKDINILHKFSEMIYKDNPAKHVKTSNRNRKDKIYKHCSFGVHSKYIVNKIIELGCMRKKSFILTFPNWLDETLYNHFIRGLIDGDGSIVVKDKQNNNVNSCIKLIITKDVIDKVRSIFSKLTGNEGYITQHKDTTVYNLVFSGNRSVELIGDYLYKNATIYLERKYQKYLLVKNRSNKRKISIK